MPNPEALRVSELAADWRNRVRLIFGQGSTGIAMLKCAAELEAALSEAAPQVDADGIVAAMVESHPMFAEWWNELPETTAQSFMDRLARHIVRDLLTRAAAALPAPGDAVRRELDTLAAYVEEARTAYAGHHSSGTFRVVANRIDKLREALAALPVVRDEGEAVAEVRVTAGYAEAVLLSRIAPDLPHGTKLYTAPPVGADWVMVRNLAEKWRMMATVDRDGNVFQDGRAMGYELCASDLDGLLAAAPAPAEARGVGDGVRALVAKWRAEANGTDILDCSKSGLMNYCADELEAALAANTRQAQAQGSEERSESTTEGK